MKPLFRSILAAAALSLPTASFAYDDPNQAILDDERFTQGEDADGLPASPKPEGAITGTDASGKDASGILMHGGSAYIVQKLGTELSLPDGSKVKPDGTILGSDGTPRQLNPGQMLTPDGQEKPAPFTMPDTPAIPGARGTQGVSQPPTESTPPPSTNSNFPGLQDAFPTPTPDSEANPDADFQD